MKKGFVREIYLRSTPSVDLELATEKVDCCKHTIPVSIYDAILEEYCENTDERLAANMWMVMSGPQLIKD